MNTPVRVDNVLKTKGVSFDAKCGKYRARICRDGKTEVLGFFDDLAAAALAYETAAKLMFGDFART